MSVEFNLKKHLCGLFRALSKEQEELADEWLDILGPGSCRDRLLSSLPEGVQRMVLLGLAMIKTPAVRQHLRLEKGSIA